MQDLNEDAQLKRAKALKAHGGLADITFHQLDITDHGSVDRFVDHLKQAHGEGIDVVINNAGIAMKGFGKSYK